jgi:hypothetical protein
MLSRNLTAWLLFLTVWAFGQEQIAGRFLYIDHVNLFLGSDENSGDLLVFTKDKYFAFNPDTDTAWREIRYKRNDLYFEIFPEEVRFVPGLKEPIFLRNGGGEVYVLRDSSLLRADRSFHHRNQYGSVYFAYKGKIYNYGGYGFFTHKEYTTEFSMRNPEWYIYTYSEKTKIPPGRGNCLYQFDSVKGRLYISEGALNTNPSIHRAENKYHSDVWVLDLATRKWRNLGFVPGAKKFEGTDWLFFAEGYTYFGYPSAERYICRLNIAQNRLDYFDARENINQVIQYRYRAAYNPLNQHFVIARKRVGESNERLILEAIPRKNIEYKPAFSKQYYLPWHEVFLYIAAILVAIFLIYKGLRLLRRYVSKRSAKVEQKYSLLVEDTGNNLHLVFEGKPIEFEAEHQGLIRLFVDNGGRLSNQALLDFVRNGVESQEVLKKRKNRLIREINDSFKLISRLNDLFLEEVQDDNDRRFRDYRIFPAYFEAIKKGGAEK